jgi:5S rRNA maturation endonuclease (ribonuclease M5)
MYSETFLADLKSRVAISEIIGRSVKLRRDGKEFRAVDNASLTINDAKGIWFDHATNEGGDALAWLQKAQGLSFTDAVAEIASMAGVPLPNGDGQARPQQGATTKRKPVASYNYCDSQGELIYEVVRLEWIEDGKRCKTFRQRRPDPDRPNGWIWNLEGVKHGLYRLPELREAGADEIVFLPEGEKDVETLIKLGLVATTNSGGAKNWRADHAEHLRDRDVVVLVDADDPGRERGQAIVASLHGIAKRIRVLDFSHEDIWPKAPKGADVTDWVRTREGDAAEIAAIVETLPDASETGPPPVDDLGAFGDRAPDDAGVSLEDFHAYMPSHSYIFTPSREMWPASSVNARIPPIAFGEKKMPAAAWLDRNKPVEQMTWAPGLPMLISNRLIAEGGWIERAGVSCFNLYRPPTIEHGDATKANRWIDHVHKVFGDDANHIIPWLAHRVQRPHEKINHALVLGGAQGIGKDTLLEPVKQAIGPWNFREASPQQMLGRFNSFLKSVVLRISEGRDLGDVDRFKFYDHMKAYTASPPDVLRVDEKHIPEHSVLNVCGVILTSNHKTDGIYLPADDRRHFVAWSDLSKEDFSPAYWNGLWGWYAAGGAAHVAAYLATLDLSTFDPKAPPPKTPAFWAIVDASQAPEDAELADVLDRMGNPEATTLIRITAEAMGEIETWLKDRKNRRAIPHRLEKCGYVPIRNDASSQGLWVINDTRQTIYAKSSLSIRDRFKAASSLVAGR